MRLKKDGLLFDIEELPTPALIYSNVDGRLIYWNKPARLLLGYSPKEKPSVEQWRSHNEKSKTKRSTSKSIDLGVIPHLTKKGEEIWVRVFEKNIYYKGKSCRINWLTDLTEHITVRKNAIENLIKINESLSDTLVFGKMGSVELDLKTFMLTISREMMLMLDVPTDQSYTMPLDRFLATYINPTYLETIHQKIGEGMQGAGLNRKSVDTEFEMITATGRRIWIEAKGFFRAASAIGILHDATGRKEKENELSKKEEREKLIFNSTLDAIVGINGEGNIIQWNKQAEKVFGWASEEVMGKVMNELIIPERYRSLHMRGLNRLHTTGKASVLGRMLELEALHKNGKTFPIEITIVAIGDGKDQFFCSFIRDITERKLAEQKIINDREHLAAIINSLPGVFYLFDEQGKFLKWNKNFETISGYSAEEIGRMVPLDFFKPNEWEMIADRISKVFGEGMADAEANFLTKYGITIPYYFNGFMTIFEGKRCVIGTGLDLTDLRKAEGESRSRLMLIEMMLKGITDGFYATDRHLNFTLVSPVFARDVNMETSAMIGRHVLDVFPFLKDSDVIATLKQSIETNTAATVTYKGILNPEKIYSKNIYPNEDGLFAFYKDVSEQSKTSSMREELLKQFEKRSNNVPGFIYEFCMRRDGTAYFPYASRGVFDLYGVTPEEIANDASPLFARMHPDDIERVSKDIQRAAETRTANGLDFRILKPDGEIIWARTQASIELQSDGSILWYGCTVDITETKKAEEEKRLVEEAREGLLSEVMSKNNQIENILFSITDYFFAIDRSFNFKLVNPSFARYSNLRVDEMVNKNAFDLMPHLKDSPLIKHYRVVMETQKSDSFEYESIINHGQFFKVNAYPNPDGLFVYFQDITAEKLANSTIIESEQRFRTMADAAPVLIWMSGKDKLCDYFNKGWLEFTGRTLEQELGNGWAEGVHPEDLERCVSIYENSFDHRKDFTMEYRLKRHDGQYRWIVDQGTPRFSPNGEFIGYIGSCFDIHDMIEAREKLSENELRLRTILETEPECVKILNERGELIDMNRAGLDMVEANDLDQVRGGEVATMVDEPYRKDFIELTKNVFKGNSGMLEFTITSLKGTSRWLETHAVPMRNPDGKITSLLGVTRDITLRKESEKKLLESEERYRRLFEVNPAPTWIGEINTLMLLQANKAAIDHYGYTEEEFRHLSGVNLYAPEERIRFLKTMEHVRSKAYGEDLNLAGIWKHQKKDGTIIDVELNSGPLFADNHNIRIITVHDVTEKLKAQHKLMDLVKEKEMLLREIHHRVKNNLQLISSIFYIQINRLNPGEMRNFLMEMRQRIKSIAFLHERLLQTESISQLEMSLYLEKLIDDLRMTFERAETNIKIHSDIDQVWMDLDSAIYCGLIMNELITNSFKYAFQGRTYGNIYVSLKKVSDKFEFIVSDDGLGMPLAVTTNLDSGSSFGMQLLDTFGKQLKAEVTIDNSKGTLFKYTFS